MDDVYDLIHNIYIYIHPLVYPSEQDEGNFMNKSSNIG